MPGSRLSCTELTLHVPLVLVSYCCLGNILDCYDIRHRILFGTFIEAFYIFSTSHFVSGLLNQHVAFES